MPLTILQEKCGSTTAFVYVNFSDYSPSVFVFNVFIIVESRRCNSQDTILFLLFLYLIGIDFAAPLFFFILEDIESKPRNRSTKHSLHWVYMILTVVSLSIWAPFYMEWANTVSFNRFFVQLSAHIGHEDYV
jgi:hypothetical protein